MIAISWIMRIWISRMVMKPMVSVSERDAAGQQQPAERDARGRQRVGAGEDLGAVRR